MKQSIHENKINSTNLKYEFSNKLKVFPIICLLKVIQNEVYLNMI